MNTKKDYQLIIFDLDGTIADTVKDVQFSMNVLRTELDLPPLSLHDTKKCIGPGSGLFVKYITPDKKNIKHNLKKFSQIYSQHLLEKTVLFPGIKTTIQRLYQAGRKLAVVTNEPGLESRFILKGLKIDHYFLTILGPEDVKNQKPARDSILMAIDMAGVNSTETWMVVDTEYDINAARAAHEYVCAVEYGYTSAKELKQLNPDFLVDNCEKIFFLVSNGG